MLSVKHDGAVSSFSQHRDTHALACSCLRPFNLDVNTSAHAPADLDPPPHTLPVSTPTGMTSINDFNATYMCQGLPFGGVKYSGFGRFAGVEGLRALCIPKVRGALVAGVRDIARRGYSMCCSGKAERVRTLCRRGGTARILYTQGEGCAKMFEVLRCEKLPCVAGALAVSCEAHPLCWEVLRDGPCICLFHAPAPSP
jgi:hypothetical protein